MIADRNVEVSGLRVLFLAPYPRGDKVRGGVEAVAQGLINALASEAEIEAIQVIAFSHSIKSYEMRTFNKKVTVHYVPGQRRLELPTGAVLNVLRARHISKEFSPHVVHAQGIGLGNIAIHLGFPVVVTVHGMASDEVRFYQKKSMVGLMRIRLTDRMVRRVLKNATIVVSTSEYDKQALGKLVKGDHVKISNPIDLRFFSSYTELSSQRILFGGMMIPSKNVLGIIRAFALVRGQLGDAHLDIVGPIADVDYASEAKQLIEELKIGSNVTFHGFVGDSKFLDLMRRSAVVILFSTLENSPTVIAQVMAIGKPVVASRVGGIPEMVIHGKTGFLVEAGDETALAARVVQLLRSPDLRCSMGLQAHSIAQQRFHPSAIAKQTIDVYRRMIK